MLKRQHWQGPRRAVLILIAATLAACSGGGSDSGSATQGATSVASEGPIAGFGSIIMNGARWNTDTAVFEIDGLPGTQADLGLGMVVRVEGDRFADGSARADRVIFKPRLRGPIRVIEVLGPDTRALEIFGIRAIVSRAETRFRGTDLDSLALDTVVELSGFVNANQELEATHLRLRRGPIVNVTEVKLFGRVSGLAGRSFILGTSEVRFDDATEIDDLGPGGLRNGVWVRVEGILLANDAVRATEIESRRRRGDDRFGETEIQGVVTDFVSLGDFQIAGQPVDASRARFVPDDPTLLRNGVRVEAEGRINSAGVLIARKVKFRSNRVRIHAEVASDADIDVAGGRILLLGIPIDVDRVTRIRDKRDDVAGFDLSDVRAGDFLEVRGIARSEGRVVATRLEREKHGDLRLRGPVDIVDAGAQMFSILGVPIPTGSATRFQAADGSLLSEAEFYARVMPGWIVQAEDDEDGDETDFDFANEVEIEAPDLDDRDDDDSDDSGSLDD